MDVRVDAVACGVNAADGFEAAGDGTRRRYVKGVQYMRGCKCFHRTVELYLAM